MRHRVTPETKNLLAALHHIRVRVQLRLGSVSPEAREEWVSLMLRVPADEDVGLGAIDLSPETLARMIAKASRFDQIVSDRAVTPDRLQNRGEARGFRQISAPEGEGPFPQVAVG